MHSRRLRPLFIAAGALVLIWLLAAVGYAIAKNSKMTEEKVREYVRSIDFGKLSAAERHKALLALAAKLNALTPEERRRARMDRLAQSWFEQMTEAEKEEFITATLPTDIKQMLNAFEQMPPDKRKKAVENAVKNLKKAKEQAASEPGENPNDNGTNAPPELSPELVQKAETLGLKTFYTEGSAETKAELAPLLEEVQHTMESGRPIR